MPSRLRNYTFLSTVLLFLGPWLDSITTAEFVDGHERFLGTSKDTETWEASGDDKITQINGLEISSLAEYTTRTKTVGVGEAVRVSETMLPGGAEFQLFLTTNSEKTEKSVHYDSAFMMIEHARQNELGITSSIFSVVGGGRAQAQGYVIGAANEELGTARTLEIARVTRDDASFSVWDENDKLLYTYSLSVDNAAEKLFISLYGQKARVHSVSVIPHKKSDVKLVQNSNVIPTTMTWMTPDRKLDSEQAIEEFNKGVQVQLKARVFFRQGVNLQMLREYDLAMEMFNKAIRLDPDEAKYYFFRGEVWTTQQKYAEAIEDYQQAAQLNSNAAPAFNNLAWALATCPQAELCDGQRAVTEATSACELTDWKKGACLGTLAAAYARSGEFDQALQHLDKALKLDPYMNKKEYKAMKRAFESKQAHVALPSQD